MGRDYHTRSEEHVCGRPYLEQGRPEADGNFDTITTTTSRHVFLLTLLCEEICANDQIQKKVFQYVYKDLSICLKNTIPCHVHFCVISW